MKLCTRGCLGVFVFLLAVSGCGDGPLDPPFSVEEEINANIPYNQITVRIGEALYYYSSQEGASNQFDSVKVERGLLVLAMSDGDTIVFNLATLSTVEIENSVLRLRY